MNPLALVVENDAGTRKLLDVVITRLGFQVDSVSGGESAIAVAREIDYSAIILDLLLPGLNGFDVLAWMLRVRPELLPRVVVLSSVAQPTLDQLEERFGVRTMRKPFELEQLVAALSAMDVVMPRDRGLADLFCRASAVQGAKTGLFVAANGPYFELLASFGFERFELEQYLPIPVHGPYPICDAFTRRDAVWLPSLHIAASEYPLLLPIWERTRTEAVVALPVAREGEVIGAAGWTFTAPLQHDQRRDLLRIADRCGAMIQPAASARRIRA